MTPPPLLHHHRRQFHLMADLRHLNCLAQKCLLRLDSIH
jgi:hypothetical protein